MGTELSEINVMIYDNFYLLLSISCTIIKKIVKLNED